MEYIRWKGDRPKLRQPILVLAFEGWNDAGEGATTAARHLRDQFDHQLFASIDPEIFYEFTTTRPTIKLAGETRKIEWPANDFFAVQIPEASRDLLVMVGTEPQLRWRTYSEQLLEIAKAFDAEMIISLGALIADVPHSRPTMVYTAGHDTELCEKLDVEPSSYEGPTGIVGIVHDALRQAGFGSISLWATVPSYVPHANSPKASLALVERVAQLLDLSIATDELATATDEYEEQVSELVSEDVETLAYVASLESEYDNSIRAGSGAEMIQDIERFLRDQP